MREIYGDDALPADFTTTAFDVPTIFHGAAADVRTAWKRAVRQAVEDGSWAGVFKSLEMTSLNTLAGDIILGTTRKDLRPKEPAWRLHWVCHTKPFIENALGKGASRRELYELTRRLIVEGMQEVWFTVGLLGLEDVESPRGGWASVVRAGVEREMLEWYVYWAPQISGVESRFASSHSPARSEMRTQPHRWLFHVLRYARLAGFDIWWDVDKVRRSIGNRYHGNCVEYLVDIGVAEIRDGHYRLRDPNKE